MAEHIIPVILYDEHFQALLMDELRKRAFSHQFELRVNENCIWDQHEQNLARQLKGNEGSLFTSDAAEANAKKHVDHIRATGKVTALGVVFCTVDDVVPDMQKLSEEVFSVRRAVWLGNTALGHPREY